MRKVACFLLLMPGIAFGSVLEYLSDYQLGLEYINHTDQVEMDFSMTGDGSIRGCEAIPNEPGRQRCSVTMDSESSSSGYGLFFAKPFRASGLIHLQFDVGFGFRYLRGQIGAKSGEKLQAKGLPLYEVSYQLLNLIIRPFVRFGITPASDFPDILLTMGPSFQLGMGEVSINQQKETVFLLTGSSLLGGFLELEVIVFRFDPGYISLFLANEVSGDENGSKFYPKAKDGMDDFKAKFRSSSSGGLFSFGLRLLTPLP